MKQEENGLRAGTEPAASADNCAEDSSAMITSRWIFGQEDISLPLSLRESVFGGELGIGDFGARDALDDFAWHAVFYIGEKPVGTGRIAVEGTDFYIGKICVLKEARGTRCGDLMTRLLIYKAFQFAGVLYVRARSSYTGFYARYGFAPCAPEEGGCVLMKVAKENVIFPSACGHDNAADLLK